MDLCQVYCNFYICYIIKRHIYILKYSPFYLPIILCANEIPEEIYVEILFTLFLHM